MRRAIAVTMGDPAGVGPELIAKMVAARADKEMIIFGDPNLFAGRFEFTQIDEAKAHQGGVSLVATPCAREVVAGKSEPENARAVIDAIELGVQAVRSGHAAALLTAPINKANLVEGAGFAHPGHTEFLATLDGAPRAVMMLAASGVLRVVPATVHCALRDVPKKLTQEVLEETIRITHGDLAKYLGRAPRIQVAGLNPHAGENGLMGDEEIRWIAPLIARLAEEFDIHGPASADTMFHARARQNYDVAVAMYHDQALIPIKTLAFDQGVNVTLGLSFLRTSPDHGTAYDIAGRGIADPSSFIAAFDLASEWSAHG